MKITILTLMLSATLFASCKKTAEREQSLQEYLNFNLDGIDYTLNPVDDTLTVAQQNIFGTTNIQMYISGFRRTATSPTGYMILTTQQANQTIGTYPSSQPCEVNGMGIPSGSLQIIQSSFATSIGEYFEGTFSGSFANNGTPHTLTGSFRAKRNY